VGILPTQGLWHEFSGHSAWVHADAVGSRTFAIGGEAPLTDPPKRVMMFVVEKDDLDVEE
jgi:hypothetical protein